MQLAALKLSLKSIIQEQRNIPIIGQQLIKKDMQN